MKTCIGIISWLPDDWRRDERIDRLNSFLSTIEKLWPEIDILIIAQNWKDYSPNINNKIIQINYKNGLGILKARKTLRDEFLKLNYDYIIMFDDDSIVAETCDDGASKFLNELNMHKSGFCSFARLNAFAISKDLFYENPFPDIDPEKGDGYEDWIYEVLLTELYPKKRFKVVGIECLHLDRTEGQAASTWFEGIKDSRNLILRKNSNFIVNYIKKYKKFPENWRELISQCSVQETKKSEPKKVIKKDKTQAYSHDNTFLYF